MPHINTSNKLTCIEGFCGAGGMSLGLKQAGFDVRLAFDINENAVETYNKNIGNHCEKLDASIVSGKFLLEKAGIKTRLDLFSGGPPCQGFSKQRRGAHLLDDDRNKLVLEYSRLVNELKPRAFLFENVEIFGQKRGKDLIDEIKSKLFDYNIYTYFICSSDFGVAQKRGRFLMIGIDKSEGKIVPKLLKSDKTLTIRDVIGQLPPPPEDYKEHPDIPNHIKCKITKINEERFSHVPPGGGWKDIPYDLRLKCHQKVDTASGGWPDVYGRLEWDKQCPTITAGFDSFTRGRYGHPSQNRAITLREGAMLQGFPVNYRFYGNRDAIRLQIGNAVPPPVSYAAGTAIINCLDTKQDKNHFNFQNPMELDKDGQFSLAI
ncbi:DNA cytosine methyltransferase [Salmonella enterica subsp. enterica serovar Havana]|uniref:Cytosine-specific methyltransferase n=6 Tax=Enterobacterales TaxID=91347 RepID=Q93K37_KLEPN|nr:MULTISPECIES: DNA cytosine methyltransferase [Enterobacteriaceae]EED3353213.1 DNA cytosine methyltransferase [Salmonella enterica subsp. enterica serovar Havana]EGC3306578.1 DNA cytosine methyltransferase [Salmonella enterica]EGX6928876.1 DNA cytosine methyltransferase [Salmonella enterica subsp. enterica serovar Liverpool]EKD8301496.1 DNA cytosine methyltransferase [Salmonella enterica subsp. enterica serovar Schwarzengrund]QLT62264.1 DNA cytosine methyltransferase [Enterobacter hormaechei